MASTDSGISPDLIKALAKGIHFIFKKTYTQLQPLRAAGIIPDYPSASIAPEPQSTKQNPVQHSSSQPSHNGEALATSRISEELPSSQFMHETYEAQPKHANIVQEPLHPEPMHATEEVPEDAGLAQEPSHPQSAHAPEEDASLAQEPSHPQSTHAAEALGKGSAPASDAPNQQEIALAMSTLQHVATALQNPNKQAVLSQLEPVLSQLQERDPQAYGELLYLAQVHNVIEQAQARRGENDTMTAPSPPATQGRTVAARA